MSLGIAFKGTEGLVLAADSRVTLTATLPNNQLLPVYYDNATKLLRVASQNWIGVVTYGAGAIGVKEPRTAYSYLPEFEAKLPGTGRLTVPDFAQRLSDFFLAEWQAANMPAGIDPMIFVVGGFDAGDTYARVFEFSIPQSPNPVEQLVNDFGMRSGGQTEFVHRLVLGFDGQLPGIVTKELGLTPAQEAAVVKKLREQVGPAIPYQFLPLQDCVDLAIFLIRTTIAFQSFIVGIRGVGGSIDVATITQTEGFRSIQAKQVLGER